MEKNRILGAELCEKFLSGSINYQEFMMEFPENDNDSELFEVFDLIEHMPPVGKWYDIGTESNEEHNQRIKRINELIVILKKLK